MHNHFLLLFILGYNNIGKKQKFRALNIAESRSKNMWLLVYVTCVENIFYNHF